MATLSETNGHAHTELSKRLPDNDLTILEDATRMLSQVSSAPEAKKLMDMAAAAEHYARKAKLGEEAVKYAREIKIDAEAMLGEFLANSKKHPPGPEPEIGRPGRPISENITGTPGVPVSQPPTIAELGLTKDESANAQKLADLKKTDPAAYAAIRSGQSSKKKALRKSKRSPAKTPQATSSPQSVASTTVTKDDDLEVEDPPETNIQPKNAEFPWSEFNRQCEELTDELRSIARRMQKVLGLRSDGDRAVEWSYFMTHQGTVGQILDVAKGIEGNLPAQKTDKKPGFIPVDQVKLHERIAKRGK